MDFQNKNLLIEHQEKHLSILEVIFWSIIIFYKPIYTAIYLVPILKGKIWFFDIIPGPNH